MSKSTGNPAVIGAALVAALLTATVDANAYEIVLDDADFHMTVEGEREPGCIVFPEAATVEKDCAGLDIAGLRALKPGLGPSPAGMLAFVVEGGVVFVRVEWQPYDRETKYPTREQLATIAEGAATAAVPGMGSAKPTTSVVRVSGVDMIEMRLTMVDAGAEREASVRGYSVPAPKGMVQIGFAASDPRAVTAMEAFADKSMATMRVAPPPSPIEPSDPTSVTSNRVGRLLTVACVCGLFVAGLVYVLRRKRA